MNIPRDLTIGEDLYQVLNSIATYKGSDDDIELVELAQVDPESFMRFLEEIGKASDPVAQSILERALALHIGVEDSVAPTQQIRARGHAA